MQTVEQLKKEVNKFSNFLTFFKWLSYGYDELKRKENFQFFQKLIHFFLMI
jgi:hypothetical protein